MSAERDGSGELVPVVGTRAVVEREHLPELLRALEARGYTIIGPTVRDGAIVYDEIGSVDEMPIGYTDRQEAAEYRLGRRDDNAVFGYTVGPQSWKRQLHPPTVQLWSAKHDVADIHPGRETDTPDTHPRYAFVGVRSCELHAIAIQDRVFLGGAFQDPTYQRNREGLCVIAVNCGQAGGTCFCVSMGTGPRATGGFDLALTELCTPQRHYFTVEVGSPFGAELLAQVTHRAADEAALAAEQRVIEATAARMGRTMDTAGIHDLLMGNLDHPRWQQVADRCLTCGNCTQVCPTCFCTTVEDITNLAGTLAERRRRWDSCFTTDFSHMVSGSVRASAKSRYRQWMTHKLATWIDQFDTSGCVGCGRCITWCPVGIDITEEVAAIRRSVAAGTSSGEA